MADAIGEMGEYEGCRENVSSSSRALSATSAVWIEAT